jgi:hypothetical protein
MGSYLISPSHISDIDAGPSLKFAIPQDTPTSDSIVVTISAYTATTGTSTTVTFGNAGGNVQTAQQFIAAINAAAAAAGANVKATLFSILGENWVWLRAAKDTKYISVLVTTGGVDAVSFFAP